MRILPIRTFNNNLNFKNTDKKPKNVTPKNTNPLNNTRTNAICTLQKVLMPQELSCAIRDCKSANRKANAFITKASGMLQTVSQNSKPNVQEALEIYNELKELYEAGDETAPEDKTIKKITVQKDNFATMFEFSKNGRLHSRTKFFDGKPILYQEGIDVLPNDSIRFSREIYYHDNGTVKNYIEGSEHKPDGTKKYSIVSKFINNKISQYLEGYEQRADGTVKKDLEILFIDEESGKYTEGYQENPDGSKTINKELWLDEGRATTYKKGFKQPSPKYSKTSDIISYKDGLPVLHKKNSIKSQGVTKSDEVIVMRYNAPYAVAIEYNSLTKNMEIGYKLTNRGWIEATDETLEEILSV